MKDSLVIRKRKQVIWKTSKNKKLLGKKDQEVVFILRKITNTRKIMKIDSIKFKNKSIVSTTKLLIIMSKRKN